MKTSYFSRFSALGVISLLLFTGASPAQAAEAWDWGWDDCGCGYQPTEYVPYTPDFYQGGFVPAPQPRYTPANYTGYIPAGRSQYRPADLASYEPAPRPQYQPASYLAYEPATRTAFYTPPGYQPFVPLSQQSDFEPLQTNTAGAIAAGIEADGSSSGTTTTLVMAPAGAKPHVATVHPNSNPDVAFDDDTLSSPATVFGETTIGSETDSTSTDASHSTTTSTTFLSRIFRSFFGLFSSDNTTQTARLTTASGIAIFFLALIPALIAGIAIANRAREEQILNRYATFSWSDTDDEDEAAELA